MSQALSHLVPVVLLSLPAAPALSFDFLLRDSALLPLREFCGSLAPFCLGIGLSLYVFLFRQRGGSKPGG
jgi:hypothetical protein